MKPIHLQIAGLHSYREQVEIDFETLCAAGLFGIFGPTGSGKSTILDAITLALYGQVVRTGGGSHPQESLNQHEQRLFVSFTFELGHHARRKRYTIEREFGLDKKGKKRQPEVRLIERATAEGEEDHVLESRATSATQAVEQLLGLTLSDFTRAVVLPQGQFSKFLTLKGSERNEMLQRIFHLHEYGEKLNERIRATVEMNKESLHRTEKELAGLGDAGPDALAQAAEELQQALDLEQNYSAQRLVLQERKEELEQIRSWQSEWQQIELQLAQLEERKQEIEAMEEQCRFIEAAIRIWPQLEKVNQLAQEHEQWTQRLELLRVKREATLQEQQRCEQVFQQSQTDMRSEEPRLLEQKGKLAEAIEWEQELAQLHTELSGWVNALQALETEQMSLSLKLTQKREELVGWQQMREALESESKASVVTPEERKKVVALRDRKLAWERELAQMQQLKQEADEAEEQGKKHTLLVRQQLEQYQKEAQLREQMAATLTDLQAKPVIGEQALLDKRECLQQMRGVGKEWRELSIEQEEWKTKHADWEKQQSVLQESLEQLGRERESLAAAYEQKLQDKQTLEQQWHDWQQQNMARVLRESLHEGEACPVCGSCQHQHQHLDASALADESDGQLVRSRLEAAEGELGAADRKLREAEQLLMQEKMKEAVLREKQTALQTEQSGLEARLERIREECRQWGDEWAVESVDALLAVWKQQDTVLRQQIEQREQHRQQLEEWTNRHQAQRETELERQRDYEKNLAVAEQIKEKHTAMLTRLHASRAAVDSAKEALLELGGDLPVEAIDDAYASLEARDRRHAELQVQKSELDQKISTAQGGLQDEQQRLATVEREAAVQKERTEKQRQLWQEKRARWLERTNGAKAADCLKQVEERLSVLHAGAHEAEQALVQARKESQQLQEAYVEGQASYESLARQRQSEEEELQGLLSQSQLRDAEAVRRYFSEQGKLAEYQHQIQEYQTRLGQLRYDSIRLSDKLAGRSITDEEYTELKESWEQVDSLVQLSRDQVAVNRQSLSRIQANHERWVELHAQQQEIIDEQSRLEELKRLFEGKAFVQFIAEEKLASIARDASYHLMQMTKNRYALELGDGGEFVLRDEGAGGIRRPVSTLSGGETFLTSLALALALSVEIQMRGSKLEFFFLDEGFGTLDPELLEVVLNALERLRMNDLTIGIISHVPELRVRMPRRLIVTPPEPLGAGSRVELEME